MTVVKELGGDTWGAESLNKEDQVRPSPCMHLHDAIVKSHLLGSMIGKGQTRKIVESMWLIKRTQNAFRSVTQLHLFISVFTSTA